MQRFEIVLQRDRVAHVTRALAELGIVQGDVTQIGGEGAPAAHSTGSTMTGTSSSPCEEVKLIFNVDDQAALDAFRVLWNVGGSAKIFSCPITE